MQIRYFIYVRKATNDDGRHMLSLSTQLNKLGEFTRPENLDH